MSNDVISSRLYANPERFIWSGLQAYYDIIQLVEQIDKGEHNAIAKMARIDFFCLLYWRFFLKIVLMINSENYFEHSKLALFCGGAVFNRLFRVSKFILDNDANISLYSFIIEHPRRGNNCHTMQELRKVVFRYIGDSMLTVVLKKGKVLRPCEMINTLNGSERDVPVRGVESDFPYP